MREILSSLDRSYTHAIQGHGINITPREKTPFRTFAVCVYTQKVVLSRCVSNPGGGGVSNVPIQMLRPACSTPYFTLLIIRS